MPKAIQRREARCEVQEVESGKVYRWFPERVVLECGCGQRLYFSTPRSTCAECGTDHASRL